jgi:beta-lactamase superfamily II metal-dependent hydrolase
MLLTTKDATIMVDTGTAASAYDVVDRLQELDIKTIDTLIITHFDQDHVGGAAEVLDAVKVDEVLTTYQSKESEEVDAYEEALERCGLTARVVSADETLRLGGMTIDILAPHKTAYDEDTSNNSSLVCRVTYGNTRFLLAGDIQTERIAELIDNKYDLTCDLLKVPHHGAWEEDGATESLIAAASPHYAVICCSKKRSEDPLVALALEDAEVTYYCTRKGEVIATSDGKTISIEQ